MLISCQLLSSISLCSQLYVFNQNSRNKVKKKCQANRLHLTQRNQCNYAFQSTDAREGLLTSTHMLLCGVLLLEGMKGNGLGCLSGLVRYLNNKVWALNIWGICISFFGGELLKCFPLKRLIFKCEILKAEYKVVHISFQLSLHRQFLEQKTK